jgi:citrate synthase
MGSIHGGNGAQAVKYLLDCFSDIALHDPYMPYDGIESLAEEVAAEFKRRKMAAKEAGQEYARIPCLGHPVFRNDAVNYDPREQVIYNYIHEQGKSNIFLEFYHALAHALKANASTRNVLAVNVDAALACIWLAICWPQLHGKQMAVRRAQDIPFIAFALGRAAGGAGEYLDHQDFGTEMDMRIPTSECRALIRSRELPHI